MNLCLISQNLDLKTALESSGYFNVILTGTDNLSEIEDNNFEIILIDDKTININSIVANNYSVFKNKKIFYMISNATSKKAVDNIMMVCKSYDIVPIPPKISYEQIVSKISSYVFPNNNINKNIISIIGTESKAGVTMISTSIAETLAKNTNAKICLISLSGHVGTDYIKDETKGSIDNIKANLMNKILTKEELMNNLIIKNNFYVLAGINNILDIRHYQPENIEYLLNLVSQIANIIILDCGNLEQIDFSGCLPISGLYAASYKYLVTTQLNSSFNSYKRATEQILNILDIKPEDFLLIINKYYKSSGLLNPEEMCKKYGIYLGGTLPFLEYKGWESDINKSTLLNDIDFKNEIDKICKIIAEQMNVRYIQQQVKKGFFSNLNSLIGR